MNGLILVLLLNAAPHGIKADTTQSLVQQTSALFPQWVEGKNIAPYAATAPELKRWLKGLGIEAAELDWMTRKAVAELNETHDVQRFTPDRAWVRVDLPQIDISFSRGTTAVSVSFIAVAKNRLAMLGPPEPDTVKTPEPNGEEHLFELRKGAWVEVEIPKPTGPDCAEVLKGAGKDLYVAEKSYFAEHGTYEGDLKKLGVTLPDGVSIKSMQATAESFRAEVEFKGTSFRIDDAKTMTFVGLCKQ